MTSNDARNTCKLLRWVEQMDQVIAECEARPNDFECVRMARGDLGFNAECSDQTKNILFGQRLG